MPTACDTPASRAASSLEQPAAIDRQNGRRSDRCNTGGRPGERTFARASSCALRFLPLINASNQKVLRQWVEFTQFTATEFTDVVLAQGCQLSMDGRGAWRDNVFVERLWRSVKYERVYLKAYDSVSAARSDIAEYMGWYNTARPHSSLDDATPDEHYFNHLLAPAMAA